MGVRKKFLSLHTIILIGALAFVAYRIFALSYCSSPAEFSPCLAEFHPYIFEFVIALAVAALAVLDGMRRAQQ